MRIRGTVQSCLFVIACVAAAACGGDDAPPAAPDATAADASIDATTTNTTLASLVASNGVFDPPFEPEVTEYHLDLVLAEADVAFTPTAAAPALTTITVDGSAVVSGAPSTTLPLDGGDRDVVIVVAEGDATTSYTVHVHRGVDALTGLVPSSGALAPAFDAATTSYAIGLPLTTTMLGWTPSLMTPGRGSITVAGGAVPSGTASPLALLAVGDNPTPVVVTPATRAARTYQIAAVRGPDTLTGITLSLHGGDPARPLVPTFDGATSTYTIAAGLWLERIQVTVTPAYTGATITVNGAAATAGTPSAPIALGLGDTAIPIVVTGLGEQRTYTLTVNRASTAIQQAYAKASNTTNGDAFGYSIAMWGDTLAVGARHQDAQDGGGVYVFTRSGATWSQQAFLKSSNTGNNDFFGQSIALWGETLVVGAPGEDSAATGIGGNQADETASSAGAVYVFTRTGTTWSQQAYVKASNTGQLDQFGSSVALSGDTMVIGAPTEDSNAMGVGGDQTNDGLFNSGAVYVFERTGTTWSQTAYVKESVVRPPEDYFGFSVALWGDTLAVGAPYADCQATVDCGAVYLYARNGATWSAQALATAPFTYFYDYFGSSVALWGDTLVVGEPNDGGLNTVDPSSGAAHVYRRNGTSWSLQQSLAASNIASNPGGQFGTSVAIWGDTVAIGASYEVSNATGVGGNQADTGASGSGAVYVFTRTSTTWTQRSYVKASNTEGDDNFGFSAALWGDTLAVGARQEDSNATGVGGAQSNNNASNSGAAYIFR